MRKFNFEKTGKYFSKSKCRFLLQYHLIFVVKYRKQFLVNGLDDFVKNKCLEISKSYDFEICYLETDKDHIHFMIQTTPQVSIDQIVRVLKQQTTFAIWKKFPNLKQFFWKEKTFWSDGYFVTTIGQVSQETLKKYIEEQGS